MEHPTLEQRIKAVTDSRPPATDDLTYLTIVETHLTPELLPTLNDILQDVHLCQKIGWDLIHMLIPLKGAEQCLKTIARLGNPREVILQVTEALRLLRVGDDVIGEEEDEDEKTQERDGKDTQDEVEDVDKFATLVSMLATLHPRIKTRYPSRFLSTSMMAILAAYKPSPQTTYAVVSFIQALSGEKRPPLPTRKSSMAMEQLSIAEPAKGETASDPEASAEDGGEAEIQKKLLQSFLTHVLELYVKDNLLEWSPRLLEHYRPEKVVQHGLRKSRCEAFRGDPALQEREVVVGQIVALAKDLSLGDSSSILSLLTKSTSSDLTPPTSDTEDAHPSSPDDVPLSRAGTLFLLTTAIFSSTLFSTSHVQLPNLTLFPTFSTLLQSFVGTEGPEMTGSEDTAVIDALLAIGLWLEENDKFVSGPLEDEEFLQLLQTLSLLSANCPDEKLRYCAHVLTGNILHAHPHDRVRLTFLSDTLEHCPYESLRASAVGWLKEELITAHRRSSSPAPAASHASGSSSHGHSHSPPRNAFASAAAISALQPYLFPYESALVVESDNELWEEFQRTYLFHMAALGFLIFLAQWEGSEKVVPEGTLSVVAEVYLGPLKEATERLSKMLSGEGPLAGEGASLRSVGWGEHAKEVGRREVEIMKERIGRCEEVGVGK